MSVSVHEVRISGPELRERCELALVYIGGTVTGLQAAAALGVDRKSVDTRLSQALVGDIRAGIVKAELVKGK